MHALFLLLSAATLAHVPAPRTHEGDVARWARQARAVTITRDDWGIPHVRGKTDADAVFGMIYAQAEDDFNRVETNYLNCDGPAGRGRGRERDLAGPADEAVHRPGQHEGEVRGEPRLAQVADGRLGGRAQLLPRHAPAGEAARHHAVRAVDGAHVQRGQHRRRHREHLAARARGVLRRQRRAGPRRPSERRARRSRRARTASRSRRRTPSTSTRCCSSIPTPRSSSAPSCR